jgi:hypothetical protein
MIRRSFAVQTDVVKSCVSDAASWVTTQNAAPSSIAYHVKFAIAGTTPQTSAAYRSTRCFVLFATEKTHGWNMSQHDHLLRDSRCCLTCMFINET